MDTKHIEKVIVDSIHLLEDTRWSPKGTLDQWNKTAEGKNYELVYQVLDKLRDTLIVLRSKTDRKLAVEFAEDAEKEYNTDF